MFKLPKDKKLHTLVCFAMAAVIALLLANVIYSLAPEHPGVRSAVCCIAAFVLTMAVGVWKELCDREQPGNHFCRYDIIADIAGAVLGSLFGIVSYLI